MDAATGVELDGYAPLQVGRGTALPSPDGSLLAVGDPQTGRVTFFDLAAWAEVAAIVAEPVGTPQYRVLSRLQWSEDSTRLFAWREFCPFGPCPHDVIDQLWEFVPASGTARLVADFGFRRAEMSIAPDGEHLYVLADRFRDGPSGRQDETPSIVVIRRATGEVVGEALLPGIEVGAGPAVAPFEHREGAGWYRPALAHHGSRLYVAHAHEERLTVVDLESMQVASVIDLAGLRSPLSQLGSWLRSQLLRRAEATPVQFWERSIMLSPDGSRLFIAGRQVIPCPVDGEGPRCWKQRPTGLAVLDTTTLEVLFREETIERFEITRNGQWLLGYAAPYEERMYGDAAALDGQEPRAMIGHGLTLVDLRSLEVAHHLWPDEGIIGRVVTSADSRYAYARTFAPGLDVGDDRECGDGCYHLHVVEIERGDVLAVRVLGGRDGLISLARQ